MQVVNATARKANSLIEQLGYPLPTEIQLRLGRNENECLTVARHCAW